MSLLRLLVSVLVAFSYIQEGTSFVNKPRSVAHSSASASLYNVMQPSTSGTLQINHGAMMQPLKSQIDGSGRGVVIQGLVLAICVWIFSIPPEFRRAFICPENDVCLANREQCNNCMTSDEWTGGIKEYYKNGGGINFNFEVGAESKAAWSK
jgi:hypothetical protein